MGIYRHGNHSFNPWTFPFKVIILKMDSNTSALDDICVAVFHHLALKPI